MVLQRRNQEDLAARVAKACAQSPHGLTVRATRVDRVGPEVGLGEAILDDVTANISYQVSSRVDSCQVFEIMSAENGLFFLSVPWHGNVPMPHELYSIVLGRMPGGFFLVGMEGAVKWYWAWEASGHGTPRFVQALTALGPQAFPDTAPVMRLGDRTYPLKWGVQTLPVNAEKYVFAAQYAPTLLSANLGLDDYLDKRAAIHGAIAGLAPAEAVYADFRFPCVAADYALRLFPDMKSRTTTQASGERSAGARGLLEKGMYKQARYAADEALRAEPGNVELKRIRDEAAAAVQRMDELQRKAKLAVKGGDLELKPTHVMAKELLAKCAKA